MFAARDRLKPIDSIHFPPTRAEVIALQRSLAMELKLTTIAGFQPQLVAAVDVAYDDGDAYAAAVIVDWSTRSIVEQVVSVKPVQAGYEPSLFALREAAIALEVLCKLTIMPALILIDGHGTAHPQHFGLACHIGLVLDIPTLGCAKTPLLPSPFPALGLQRGSICAVLDNDGHELGSIVRTQDGVKPVYVSPGNHLDVPTSAVLVLDLASQYRLPEPLRLAHHRSIMFRSTKANSPIANQWCAT